MIFCHSLRSDWNNGHAHFLRGVVGELQRRGHTVDVYEPMGAWSVQNAVRDHGGKALLSFHENYPGLMSHVYDPATLELDRVLSGASMVLVQEWNDPGLVARLGAHRRANTHYRLYWHDAHHRIVTDPAAIDQHDLSPFDAVLAFGPGIRDRYLDQGHCRNAYVWHEAADTRVFYPRHGQDSDGDLVWIGNWGDEERSATLEEYLIHPVETLGLRAAAYGVRYPKKAKERLAAARIAYNGWLPNPLVPDVLSRHRLTVHIPRGPYVADLPGTPTIRVFEALASGVPLVCSPWAGADLLFEPGQDFLMAEDGDDMTEKVSMLLGDRRRARELAEAGLKTVRRHHTVRHRVDELLRIDRTLQAAPARRNRVTFRRWEDARATAPDMRERLVSRHHVRPPPTRSAMDHAMFGTGLGAHPDAPPGPAMDLPPIACGAISHAYTGLPPHPAHQSYAAQSPRRATGVMTPPSAPAPQDRPLQRRRSDLEPVAHGPHIAFFGSSLLSSYWNGAATYYRGLLRALAHEGCQVTFYEPDAFDRQKHLDYPMPDWAEVVVWDAATTEGADRALRKAADADVVVKASGVGVLDSHLERRVLDLQRDDTRVLFWDVDAPATLQRLEDDPDDPFHALVPRYDGILTYGGGPPVVRGYEGLGARFCTPIYNAVDPREHHPVPPDPAYQADLSLLANRLPDREARIHEFFLGPAAARPDKRFLLGGNGWEPEALPGNVRALGHVPMPRHNTFNRSAKAVLNVTRESMARLGHSPATRVFEAAGAGACLVSDAWPGMERFLEPGKEVLLAENGDEVVAILDDLDEGKANEIGDRARARVLSDHTYTERAKDVIGVLERLEVV